VSSADEVELAGSRGTANFALKWVRDARQQANLQVVEDIKGLPLRYTGECSFQAWFDLVYHLQCDLDAKPAQESS
jgi:hypothetical protein